MIHIVLHFVVPLLVGFVFYADRWRRATVIMIATMFVDVDHLLADPVYDPERCSIGFHPLHSSPAILVYAVLFALPLIMRSRLIDRAPGSGLHALSLVGLGLLIHMALDLVDCVI